MPKKLTQENNGGGWKPGTARSEVTNRNSRFHLIRIALRPAKALESFGGLLMQSSRPVRSHMQMDYAALACLRCSR
jgi:hypothetical protein